MSKTDKSKVIIVFGDNNKIYTGERSALTRAIHAFAIALLLIALVVAVLVISHCCPDLCADAVRLIISSIVNS